MATVAGLGAFMSSTGVVAIERQRDRSSDVIGPTKNTELLAGDILLVDLYAPRANADAFRRRFALEELPLTGAYFSDRSQEIGMAEVMVAVDSGLVGKTVVEAAFRTRYRLSVIGLRHGRVAVERGLVNKPLQIGDTLLLIGPWKDIQRLRSDTSDLLVLNLPAELDEVIQVPGKAPQAVFCLLLMVVLMNVRRIRGNIKRGYVHSLNRRFMRPTDAVDRPILTGFGIWRVVFGGLVFFLIVEVEKLVIRSSDSLRSAVTAVEAGT
jgi:di/tricarboxylate transporter